MKSLEKIKSKLPKGIDVRISSKNIITFRARFRKKGYPSYSETFPDLKLAKAWLDEQNRNAFMGIHLPHVQASEHTVSEAINRYIVEELPRKPKNARNVLNHLERFRKEIGEYTLSAVRPSLIHQLLIQLENELTPRGKKRSPTTVLRYITSLSHLFTVAVKNWEWMHENPVLKITKPSAAPGRQRFLNDEERTRLLDAARKSQSPVLYTITVIALTTGMRKGEIMQLQCEDIDFENKRINLKTSKNGLPRKIPLIGHALELIRNIYSLRSFEQFKGLLFPSPSHPKKPYDIETAWKNVLVRAKIEDFCFHDLRHTAASYQALNRRNLHEIGTLLGHKSIQTTKRYAHLVDTHTEQMIEEVDRKIFGG